MKDGPHGADQVIKPMAKTSKNILDEARAFGLRSGMSLARAAALCPQAVLLPADFDEYRRVPRLLQASAARGAPRSATRRG